MLPGVNQCLGEVGVVASERQIVRRAHSVINLEGNVGIVVIVHLLDPSGEHIVRVAGVHGNVDAV